MAGFSLFLLVGLAPFEWLSRWPFSANHFRRLSKLNLKWLFNPMWDKWLPRNLKLLFQARWLRKNVSEGVARLAGMERTTMTAQEHRKNLLLLAAAIIVGVLLLAVGNAEAICR